MKIAAILILCLAISSFACKNEIKNPVLSDRKDSVNFSTIEILENNQTPTVDIPKYTLISNSGIDRKEDAKEILIVKRKWPLAMQSLNPSDFDSILAKNFVFKGTSSFFNRTDYIKDRTTPDQWKITNVRYDNMTLQFFDNVAILSYRNHVTNENSITKKNRS